VWLVLWLLLMTLLLVWLLLVWLLLVWLLLLLVVVVEVEVDILLAFLAFGSQREELRDGAVIVESTGNCFMS
jgi:hypothetical protein